MSMPTAAPVNLTPSAVFAAFRGITGNWFNIIWLLHNPPTAVPFKAAPKSSISTSRPNTAHGRSILKQVSQVAHLIKTHAAAEKEAIKTCEQGGRNAPCVVGIWVRNGCIAVAQGKSGGKVKTFYGQEPSPGRAEPSALKKCQAAGVAQCKIVASEGCSLPRY